MFLFYASSFLCVGIHWNNHHHMLQIVSKINGAILWANLHLLFWLSLIPLFTGWMGENHFAPAFAPAWRVNAAICGNLNAMRFHFFAPLFLMFFVGGVARAETTTSGVLMSGTRFQTPYFVKTGDDPGPTIVVVGGVHGDETAGYLAARQLKKWRVQSGTLVLVPDANVPAIKANRRFVGRNMNALFPGKADGDGNQRLAAAIWNLIKKSKPDLLLTLHESRGFYSEDKARYGQTFTFDFPTYRDRFARVAEQVNQSIAPGRERFSLKIEAFATCPTYCATKYLGIPATSIETARPLPLARRIDYQLRSLRAFFDQWEMQVTST